MLLTNIVTTVATACAVLAPAVNAADEVKAQKSGKTDCSSNVGKTRNYSRDICYALYSTDWGMKIVDYDTRCKGKKQNPALALSISPRA